MYHEHHVQLRIYQPYCSFPDERTPFRIREQVQLHPNGARFHFKVTETHHVKFAPAPSTGTPWPLPHVYKTQVFHW